VPERVAALRHRIRRGDDRWRERLRLDRVVARSARPHHRLLGPPAVSITGDLPVAPFLVATSHQGLLLVADGTVERVGGGCSYYGLSAWQGTWLAFERLGRWGRIVRFDGRWAAATVAWGLSAGIHQLAVSSDEAVVTDTYNNRLLVLGDLGGAPRHRAQVDGVHHPAGRLAQGRRSPNYAHFNSVRRHGDVWYVVAHNESARTGRSSELYTLDERFDTKDIRPLAHTCCHNFVEHRGVERYCGSGEGVLVADDVEVLRVDAFTRGLAVSDDLILLGASPHLARTERGSGIGHVYVLDTDHRTVAVVAIASTQVHDVQFL
jgi:hypothetical protein